MIIPATRYQDPEAALAFLTTGLGLSERLVVRDDSGSIVHAQMGHDSGTFMFGPAREGNAFDALMALPPEIGGRETTTMYLVVDDVDGHYKTALEAGAESLIPPTDEPYGGRSFTIRDPGGHIWTVGSYRPET